MTLHDAIYNVLKEYHRPLSSNEIATIVNSKNYYSRANREPVESKQVLSRVKNYPSLFQNINGQIILVEDNNWKNLLTSYWYLVNTLRGIYIVADIQFLISALLFYRRLVDINHRTARGYPLDFESMLNSNFDRLFYLNKNILDGFKSLEIFRIAPQGVFDECARLLEKLDDYKLKEIWNVIKQINTHELDDIEFGKVFEYFLTLDSLDAYNSTVIHTPYSLKELMVGLLAPKPGSMIYDPVAGTGGLLIEALLYSKERNGRSKGTEINKRVAQLGKMNLLMHGIHDVDIEGKDCFDEINNDIFYDSIIADLPANGVINLFEHDMLYSRYNLVPPRLGKSFGSLVLLVLSKLNLEGKAVMTVSDGFLSKRGKEIEIRELLVRKDVIETVISLPHGTLRPYTDAKASLLILNNSKPSQLTHRIRFITAKAIDQDSKSLSLNYEEIIKAYRSNELLSKDSQIINISELRPDFNLLAESYDAEYMLAHSMLKEGSGKMLSELVEIRTGVQPSKADIDKDAELPLIKIENLSKDILDLQLGKEFTTKVYHTSKYTRSIINEDCIIIARIGDLLKPTIYKPDLETPAILVHSNAYALIPLKFGNEINIEYLYYQLHSSFVQEQIEKRRLGAVMPYVSISSLKQIVIPYIKPDSQSSFVESQKANLIAEERFRVEERIKALGYKEEVKQTESDIVRTLVHQLRPTLLNIDLEVKKLKRIIDQNGVGGLIENVPLLQETEDDLEFSDHINEVQDYTLEEITEKLRSDTLRLSEVLTTVNKVMSFKLLPEDFENVELMTFISEYLKTKEIDIDGRYKIVVNGDRFNVDINKTALKELIDQLLLNAYNHGFMESPLPVEKRLIEFHVRRNREQQIAIIEYQNNGLPFNLHQDDFVKPFHKSQRSSGSGIGGNYIFRIVEAHNGEISIERNWESGFAITIELPLKQIKEYE